MRHLLKMLLNDFSHAIQLQPSFHEAIQQGATYWRKVKRYEEALTDYKTKLLLWSPITPRHISIADSWWWIWKRTRSKKDFSRAIGLNHKNSDAHNNLGIILANENKFDEALSNYNKAITLNPDYTQAYYNRGNLFKKENKFDEALSDYNKAVELQPDLSKGTITAGFFSMKQKKYEERD